MNKLILSLISYPIFLAPLFLGGHTASAQEFTFEAETNSNSTGSTTTCTNNNNTNNNSSRFNPTCHRIKKEHQQNIQSTDNSENNPYNDLVADFSEEESNSSVALFGCDCPACINALRQLRSLSPTNNL